jgi:hypothetical protein
VAGRARRQDANGAGSGAIYVPRGNYQLDLTGSGGDARGDLDVTGDVTVITRADDGIVWGSDLLILQQTVGSSTDFRADADDNGVIDGVDLDWWELCHFNTLTLTNVA